MRKPRPYLDLTAQPLLGLVVPFERVVLWTDVLDGDIVALLATFPNRLRHVTLPAECTTMGEWDDGIGKIKGAFPLDGGMRIGRGQR